MASITLNGAPVLELSLSLPMSGAWSADVQVASGDAPALGAAAFLSLPGQSFEGVVKRSGSFGERVQVRVIGGLVDWQEPLTEKNYQKTDVTTVLEDMGVTTDEPVPGALAFWSRPSGTIGEALQQVADHLGLSWRVNPNGSVRLRAEAPQTVNPGAVELERDEARGVVTLAVDRATVLPGTIVGADTAGDVTYTAVSELRCRYFTAGRGGLRNSLERLIRWMTRDSLYLGTYTCEVSRQAADGTLDLMPFDSRLRATGLQAVPIRHGLPGVKEIQVPAGQLVQLAFDEGKPSKPYASLFHNGVAIKIVLDANVFEMGGALAVAMAAKVDAALSAHLTAFNTHSHLDPVSGALPPPTLLMTPDQPTASVKLFTE